MGGKGIVSGLAGYSASRESTPGLGESVAGWAGETTGPRGDLAVGSLELPEEEEEAGKAPPPSPKSLAAGLDRKKGLLQPRSEHDNAPTWNLGATPQGEARSGFNVSKISISRAEPRQVTL